MDSETKVSTTVAHTPPNLIVIDDEKMRSGLRNAERALADFVRRHQKLEKKLVVEAVDRLNKKAEWERVPRDPFEKHPARTKPIRSNRNKPCECGSKKKTKFCCGKR